MTYTYNTEDELLALSVLGQTQSYSYNDRGLVTAIAMLSETLEFDYDALSRLTSRTAGAMNQRQYSYDPASQLTAITDNQAAQHQYSYDSVSRITQWTQPQADYQLNYDNNGRLTSATSGAASERYVYDDLGNRTDSHIQGVAVYAPANRLIEDAHATYVYDIKGNRIQKSSQQGDQQETYSYNSLNQLTHYQKEQLSDGTLTTTVSLSYSYGPQGRRWSKTDELNSQTHQFYWSGSQLIAEQFPDGTERIYLNGALSPLGFMQEGQSYYVHEDHHGLAHEIVDENNITQWQASFDSFGNVTSQPVQAITYNQRFPGQYADVESGLYYNYYRDYDPQAGRYLQSDPIGLAGGLNTYGYVGGNPLYWIDFFGLAPGDRAKRRAQNHAIAHELNRTYHEMLNQNIIGADQFFHCLAACRASKSSNNASAVIARMNMKEARDYVLGRTGLYGNQGALSHEAMMEDIQKDQAANEHGAACPSDENCNRRCLRFIDEMEQYPHSQKIMLERYSAE